MITYLGEKRPSPPARPSAPLPAGFELLEVDDEPVPVTVIESDVDVIVLDLEHYFSHYRQKHCSVQI